MKTNGTLVVYNGFCVHCNFKEMFIKLKFNGHEKNFKYIIRTVNYI